MKNNDKNIAFIPLRGGSKSIPLKNIKLINGRPLVYWVIDAAVHSKYISEVVIATDSDQIKRVVNLYNHPKVQIVERSIEVSTDTASTESVMLEFSMKNKFDNILLLQATSPLVNTDDIDNAFELFYSRKYDSILSVVRQKRFIWNRSNGGDEHHPLNYDVFQRPRRQEFDGFLVENGAIYLTRKIDLDKYKSRLSGSIGVIEMDETTYYEIDELTDWLIVENLLTLRNKDKIDEYKNVKCIITDCDGVLTDGGMYYSENGDELKKFNTKDGMGLRLAQENGIKVGIITGEDSKLVKRRAEKLKLDFVYLGIKNKLEILDAICKKYSFTYDDIAYIGDDLNDLEVIKKVGHSFAVNDASPVLKNYARKITKLNGGAGAVREICDLILSSKKEKS